VHKEKDTNRKLQIKLKQLTNLLNDAKLASEREVEDLSTRLRIEMIDRKQSEADAKNLVHRINEKKSEAEGPSARVTPSPALSLSKDKKIQRERSPTKPRTITAVT